MNLTFTKATKTKSKARIAIDGPSGAGKTYTALILATVLADGGKIAVIDTERGSASLYSDKFTFDVLELDTFSPTVYTEAINAAEQAGYPVIVIDSLSHAWEGEGGALELVDQKATRIQGNSYAAWKDVTPIHRRMVDTMLQSKSHIIVTMRSKMDYVQEKSDKGNTIIRKVGMAPIQRQGMEYEFTIVADMDVEHHISISKSRCDAMTDKVMQKPGADFWKPFVNWLNDGAAPKQEQKQPAPQPQPKAEPQTGNVDKDFPALRYEPEALRDHIQKYAEKAASWQWNEKQDKLLAAMLGAALPDDTDRHVVQYFLTGYQSLKEMPNGEKNSLLKWLEPTKDSDGKYRPADMAMREARAALEFASVQMGQQPLMQ